MITITRTVELNCLLGTSDQSCWLANARKILIVLKDKQRQSLYRASQHHPYFRGLFLDALRASQRRPLLIRELKTPHLSEGLQLVI